MTSGNIVTVTGTYVRLLPPNITSGLAVTLDRGDNLTYKIVASGNPTSYRALGELPQGVTFDTGTGVFDGPPLSSGRFPITIQATNAIGTDSATLVLLVKPKLVNQTVSVSQGQALAYAVQAAAEDGLVSFTSGPLPAGLTLASGGIVQGAPTVSGIFSTPISVINPGGTATATLRFFIRPESAGSRSASGRVDQPLTPFMPVMNSDPATTFDATGLPAGVSIEPQTGLVKRTPTQAGMFRVSILVTNNGETALYPLDLTIDALLVVERSAGGTVSSNFDPPVEGQSAHTPGMSITVQAQPNGGYYFAGWSGSVPARTAILTFAMPVEKTTVRAEFRQITSSGGSYFGVATGGGRAAKLTLAISRAGLVTGQVRMQGRSFVVRTTLNSLGTLHADLKASGLAAPIPLDLQLSVLQGSSALVGTLDQGLAAFPVRLDLVAPVPPGLVTRYTVAFPTDPSRAADAGYPQGHGLAALQLTRTGAAIVVGALGDGTAFTASAQLTPAGTLALYFEVYGGRGSVAGQ